MPSPYLKTLAKETGKSIGDLERYWKKAKEITKDDFNVDEKDFQDKHYAYATAIVKRMAGVKEQVISVVDFIESGKSADDFISETVTGGDFPKLDKDDVQKKDKEEKEKEEEKEEVIEKIDPSMVKVEMGYYTDNGIMIEAVSPQGEEKFINFKSIEEANENGFEITEDMII